MKCIHDGKEYTRQEMENIENVLENVMSAVKNIFDKVVDVITSAWEAIKKYVGELTILTFILTRNNPIREARYRLEWFDNVVSLK